MRRYPVLAPQVALAALVGMAAPLPAAPETRAEGHTWSFRVLLGERTIGRHQFTLNPAGEEHEVHSEARFDVRLLFLTAWSYRHEAIERWQGDCLLALESRTETNGESESVRAITEGQSLVVEHQAGRDEHDGCIMSFAYWNPRILAAKRLLNSQTGELLPVTITSAAEESLAVRGEHLRARRHRITGPDLEIDLWYAGERWVGLEAAAPGGKRLRYVLD